ncbi:MAG: MBL fold metallo-hydrolase [Candidatus Sericytochromatia bacterium]|nr:MBL fold metallo-hydrolase [Candidatus Sericytochromatia bacterium]
MLEDQASDVIRKAMWGFKLGRDQLGARCGLSLEQVQALLDGTVEPAWLRAVAPPLGLAPEALVDLATGAYQPRVEAPPGLASLSSPFRDFFVNAYVLWDLQTREALAFDTGTEMAAWSDVLQRHGLRLRHVFVTHTHRDHVAVADALCAETGATLFAPLAECLPGAQAVRPGDRFTCGTLAVEARETSGHTVGGTSYLVRGLAREVVCVGDALFAGSMGGGLVSHEQAIAHNRRALMSLPDDTVVAPGHGPLTTIGLERRHNPFLAGLA